MFFAIFNIGFNRPYFSAKNVPFIPVVEPSLQGSIPQYLGKVTFSCTLKREKGSTGNIHLSRWIPVDAYSVYPFWLLPVVFLTASPQPHRTENAGDMPKEKRS